MRRLQPRTSDSCERTDQDAGLGFGEALDELLTNAMLFVLPSDLEGLSLALLDAMGAGLCVLATDVPENREVVKDAGFTFERGNATDLAGMLRFLIANPVVREAAGRAARKRIRERYLWSDVTANVAQVYAEVTGQPAVYSKKPSGRAMAAASGITPGITPRQDRRGWSQAIIKEMAACEHAAIVLFVKMLTWGQPPRLSSRAKLDSFFLTDGKLSHYRFASRAG